MASMAGTRTISIKPSLQIAKGARKASQIPMRISLRRRRDAFTKTTSRADGGLNGSSKNENARALEVTRNFNVSSPEISSNPSMLPRPLTGSDLSSSGGPIILAQVENEHGDIEKVYGDGGKLYAMWAENMVLSQDIGVPWIM